MRRPRHLGGLGSLAEAGSGRQDDGIELIATQGASATNTASPGFSIGSGLELGDLLVVAIVSNAGATHSAPGWRRLLGFNQTEIFVSLYNGEPASHVFQHSGTSTTRIALLQAYRKPSRWRGITAGSVVVGSGGITTQSMPTLTTDEDGAFVFFAGAFDAANAPTASALPYYSTLGVFSNNPTRRIYAFGDLAVRKGETSSGLITWSAPVTYSRVTGVVIW